MVIAYADWKMRMEDPRFPVGQARLEAIGVLACESMRPGRARYDLLGCGCVCLEAMAQMYSSSSSSSRVLVWLASL